MEVQLETRGNVAVVTLDAPARRNALTPEMARELSAALDRVDEDETIGALVLRGEGRDFCSGAHLGTLGDAGADPASEAAVRDDELFERAMALARQPAADPALSRKMQRSFKIGERSPGRRMGCGSRTRAGGVVARTV